MDSTRTHDSHWFKLDPVVCNYWMVKGFLTLPFFLVFFILPVLFASVVYFFAVFILVMIGGGSLIILWATLFYERYLYQIKRDGIYINRGIWFKTSRVIPYERIQHISVTRGPLQILFGISDINLFTAGTGSMGSSAASRGMFGAEGFIPGLRDPEPLKKEIWKRVKMAKSGSGLGDEFFEKKMDTISSLQSEGEVLQELKKIRKLLEHMAKK